MTKKIVVFFSTIVSLASLTVNLAFAQTPQGISLSVYPSSFDFHAKPGDTIEDKFRVRNDLTQPQDLKIVIRKLITDATSGQPVPADMTAEDNYSSWIHIENVKFTALPKEWTDIKFTINIPKDAAFGYYYVFEIQPAQEVKSQGNAAVVTGRISVPALLTVESAATNSTLKIVDFSPSTSVNEYLPVTFLTKVQNTGNVHLRPKGSIFISGLNQKDVATIDVNQIRGAVLPQGTRTFTSEWSDGFLVQEPVIEDGKVKTDSNGKPVTKLKINWNKLTDFRFGKYTAHLLLVYDTGKRDETLEATTSFWVVPYKAIIIIVISILLTVLLIRWLLKSYINRELQRRK